MKIEAGFHAVICLLILSMEDKPRPNRAGA